MDGTLEILALALIVVIAGAVVLGDYYRDMKKSTGGNFAERQLRKHLDEILRDRAQR